jgi:predicted TIM-barrel fold metal-dependent hydrolase
MTDPAVATTFSAVDAAVHPFPRDPDEIREYMSAPLSKLRFPGLDGYFYPPPKDEYRADSSVDGTPGSDPALARQQLFVGTGVDCAILLPVTRGLLPDVDMASELCSATNEWLADRWLAEDDDRFYGSIRVNPADPERAIREMDRWAAHPRMVQVAVPLQAHHPYGQRMYRPIWERAAHHGLPVAVHADNLGGNEFWPTSVGYPIYYVEYAAQYPINYVVHLMSLIAEGVFEDIEELVFVFADGGIDMLFPLLWRFDSDWRALRSVTPWVKRQPLTYLRDHVRFCSHRLEGPVEASDVARWADEVDAEHLLMYSSNYPGVSFQPADAFADAPPTIRRRVLSSNALDTYRRLRPGQSGAGAV